MYYIRKVFLNKRLKGDVLQIDNNVSNLREENSFEEKMGNLLFTLVPLALFLIVSFTTLGLLRGLAMYFVSSTLMLIYRLLKFI